MTWPLVVMALLAAIGPVLAYLLARKLASDRAAWVCSHAMWRCLSLDNEENVEGAVWAIAEVWSDTTSNPVLWLDAARQRVGYCPAETIHEGERP